MSDTNFELNFFAEDCDYVLPPEFPIQPLIESLIIGHGHNPSTINVIFCSDEYLRQVNKEYLNHDYFTDIITFPMSVDPLCADLFISVDRVTDNARRYDVSFLQELARVIIHGNLHLVGYNDKTDEEKIKMTKAENKYLAQLF